MITPTYIARIAAIDAGTTSTAAAVAVLSWSPCLGAGTQTVVFVIAVVRFHVLGLCSICTFICSEPVLWVELSLSARSLPSRASRQMQPEVCYIANSSGRRNFGNRTRNPFAQRYRLGYVAHTH